MNNQAVSGVLGDESVGIQMPDETYYNAFYQTPEFWFGVTFVLVVIVLFRLLRKTAILMLDKRIDAVVKRINDAENLKTEARKLLAGYEEKSENVEIEIDEILKRTEEEISVFKEKSARDIEKQINFQEQHLNDRIESIKNRVSEEIINIVSDSTIAALKKVISDKLSEKEKVELIDNSIDFISKLK